MRRKTYMLGVIFCCLTVPAMADYHHGKAPAAHAPPPVFDDLGTLHHAIMTSSQAAQHYFNQGLRVEKRFHKAWAKADVKLTASRFCA